ncbi:organic cation transporter protein isoform X2 [Lingula anatina]|uniref:Organic cation transporter protein isoform X2 n=1 Tax=Lingula anatina TaxID=7574 RepID=A0A1S3J956_LINAN|nr:organic cation transporter protein isoform X2 [Lingula anatina]XP_013406937.1 organic cation transporter protein isoform X2 [Lingula anatina]XP_013406938.1 organic cation transporter protein isoform X2 [Lingula anatina]|eukprot:XP_013406936.1 organic cation transporter protein isoform X2 [Lingula anatina]
MEGRKLMSGKMVSTGTIQVDKLLEKLGQPGRYHVFIYILICMTYWIVIFNHVIMAVYGRPPPHHCTLPKGNFVNRSIPLEKGKPSSCKVYENFTQVYGNETVPTQGCSDGWTYTLEPGETNFVADFDLVCDNKPLVSLATTIYFCGVMLGGLIFGTLSDLIGRKPVFLITLFVPVAIGVGIFFVQSYVAFVVLRFFVGVCMQGLQTSGLVLILEMFRPVHRTKAGLITELFWGSGVLIVGVLQCFIKDWHYIQLAIALPPVLAIGYIWIIPESPRWLIQKKKFKLAEQFFIKVANFNKTDITSSISDEFAAVHKKEDGSSVTHYTILDMFKTPKLRKRTFLLFYIWLSIAVNYYGMLYGISALPGNYCLNFLIGGFVEVPAYIATIFLVECFGRKKILLLFFFVGGVTCIAVRLVPSVTGYGLDISWLPLVLALIGRASSAGSFAVIPLFTSELYPTVIRNIGVGTCAFWTRLGGVLFSPILLLSDYTFRAFPFVLFGVMALLAGLLTLLLPETLNKKLPEVIEDAENFGKQANDKSSIPEEAENETSDDTRL